MLVTINGPFGIITPVVFKPINELTELTDVAHRLQRIRKLCDDLDVALGAAERQRDAAERQRAMIAQMKEDAEAVCSSLTTERVRTAKPRKRTKHR